MDRVATFRTFIAKSPQDPFPRYGLAMELRKRGQLAEAIAEFRELVARNPGYIPTYLMAGNALVEQGDRAAALALLHQRITAARAAGDAHALGEPESAAAALEG